MARAPGSTGLAQVVPLVAGASNDSAKVYDATPRPVTGVLAPVSLGAVAAKGVALHMAPVIERYCTDVEQWAIRREEQELHNQGDAHAEPEPMPAFPNLKPALQKAQSSACKDVLVQSTRRLLERAAAALLLPRSAWKLLKDAPRSCRRKAERALPLNRLTRSLRAGRCGARAHCLTAMAELVVMLAGSLLWPPPADMDSRTAACLRTVYRTGSHLVLSVACAALLCALVALAFPRKPAVAQYGTALALLSCDEVASLIERLAHKQLQRNEQQEQEDGAAPVRNTAAAEHSDRNHNLQNSAPTTQR